jgi:hypothetical protein
VADPNLSGGFYGPSVAVPAGGGGGGSTVLVSFNFENGRATSLNAAAPEILYEEDIDLGAAGSPTHLALTGIAQVLNGGTTGTFTVYVGALTPGDTTGGTVQLTATTVSSTEERISVVGASFVSPGGNCLIQIVGVNSAPASDSSAIRGITLKVLA